MAEAGQIERKGIERRDVAGVAGAALVAGGAGVIYWPAGVIVLGLMLLGGAALSARRG